MALERDFELLDDYLANRLGQEERSAFEEKLKADSELRNELDLQQQFIEGIKKARVAELKSLMNNIPVPAASPSVGAAAGKVAAGVVLIGLIGTGLYFYLDTEPVTNTSKEVAHDSIGPDADHKPHVKHRGDTSEEAPVVPDSPAASAQKPADSPKAVRKQNGGTKPSAKEPAIDVFDPSSESTENTATEPAKEVTPKVSYEPSVTVEIDSENKKYNFHYQFKDGHLVLYGPFVKNDKNLYEIMEFFNDKKRTLFLFYSEQYYLLKEDNNKLKPLTAIEDPALIKRLKEYRNN
jgi:hypothetical protein